MAWKVTNSEGKEITLVLCSICGFYRLDNERCSINDCPENPATKKRKRKKPKP